MFEVPKISNINDREHYVAKNVGILLTNDATSYPGRMESTSAWLLRPKYSQQNMILNYFTNFF